MRLNKPVVTYEWGFEDLSDGQIITTVPVGTVGVHQAVWDARGLSATAYGVPAARSGLLGMGSHEQYGNVWYHGVGSALGGKASVWQKIDILGSGFDGPSNPVPMNSALIGSKTPGESGQTGVGYFAYRRDNGSFALVKESPSFSYTDFSAPTGVWLRYETEYLPDGTVNFTVEGEDGSSYFTHTYNRGITLDPGEGEHHFRGVAMYGGTHGSGSSLVSDDMVLTMYAPPIDNLLATGAGPGPVVFAEGVR